MKKQFLGSMLFLIFFISATAQNAYITQALQQRIDSLQHSSDNFIRVDIIMAQQLDCYKIKADMDQEKLPANLRPGIVMKALKNISDESNDKLVEIFNKNAEKWKNKESYWLVNMIVVEVTPDFIEELVKLYEIEYIDLDDANRVKPIKPIEATVEKGKSIGGIEPGIRVVNAPALWAMGYTGRGRIGYTLDTGIWPNHPAFRDQFIGNHFQLSRGWYGFDSEIPRDKSGTHGTHVTGTILGLDPYNADTIGSAFNAYFMVSDPVATSLATVKPITSFIGAFQWAFNPDGDTSTTDDIPDVINNSWGYDVATDTSLCHSFVSQMLDAIESAGIAAVFSAGNEGPGDSTISTPHHINTGFVNSFTVGSISPHDTTYPISSFSSRGPSICPASGALSIKPEVVAPGYQIRSSINQSDYAVYNGTSMASPHVSGVILLLKEAFPMATGEEILLALYYTAHDLGIAGEDNTYGRGLIDALAAFNHLSQTYTPVPPVTTTYDISIAEIIYPPKTIICDTVFQPEIKIKNQGDSSITGLKIYYKILGGNQMQYHYTGTISQNQTLNIVLPMIAASPGNKEMIFQIRADSTITEADNINNFRSVRFNIRPYSSLPLFEDFETDNLLSHGWHAENPDALNGWTTDTTGGLWGYRSAKMECWGYSPKANQHDDLVSPVYKVPSASNFTLIFNYAYQLRLPAIADTLRVYLVSGCNLDNKTLVWEKGGQDLETFDSLATYFIPKLPSHWGGDTVDLSSFAKLGELMLDFQTTNRFGNNIYVDNIRLFTGTTPPNGFQENEVFGVRVYPNPTRDRIYIQYADSIESEILIELFDIYGKKIDNKFVFGSEGKIEFQISSLENGVYFIRYQSISSQKTFKIIKQ